MGDVDRAIDAAIRAAQAALDRIRSMHRSLDRADAALRLSREMRGISEEASEIQHAEVLLAYDSEKLSYQALADRFGISKALAHRIVKNRDAERGDAGEEAVTEPADIPEEPSVAVAIITSHAGVLLTRRVDGKPLWGFLSGKIEAGESAAEAATREAMEEAGLRIRPVGVIARRNHPLTGRNLVYMAARTTQGTDVAIGDPEEIAELRWVDADEADKLTDGMIYEPVRQHIRHTLKNGNGNGPGGK